MKIIWDEEQDAYLVKTSGISFEDFVESILNKDYLDIVENKAWPDQMIFICRFKDYTCCIPFLLSNDSGVRSEKRRHGISTSGFLNSIWIV